MNRNNVFDNVQMKNTFLVEEFFFNFIVYDIFLRGTWRWNIPFMLLIFSNRGHAFMLCFTTVIIKTNNSK